MSTRKRAVGLVAASLVDPWKLPLDWRWRPLGELVDQIVTKVRPALDSNLEFVGLDAIAPNVLTISGTVPFKDLKSAGSEFASGDVLYGRLRPYLNKVWLADRSGACSGEFLVLRPKNVCDPSYIRYALHDRRCVNFASHKVTGDRPRIDYGALARFPVAVPPRLKDQQTVASSIKELLADIDNGELALTRARTDLEVYRRSLLKAAVTGELTADWRAANPPQESGTALLARILAKRHAQWSADPKNCGKRYKEPARQDTCKLPKLPDDWTYASLDALMEGDIQNGLYLPQSAYGSGSPIMRIDDFQSGVARESTTLRLVAASFKIGASYSLSVGDIVINRVNSPSHLGKSFLVRRSHVPALFESNMMRLKPTPLVLGDYIELYLGSAHGRAQLCRNAKMAVNQASINQADVRNVQVPLPPRGEQQKVVELHREMGSHDLLESVNEQCIMSSQLRQSILAAAFRGELL